MATGDEKVNMKQPTSPFPPEAESKDGQNGRGEGCSIG